MAVQEFLSLLLLFSVKFSDLDAVTINATRLGAADYRGTGVVEVFVVQYNIWLPVCSTSWDNSAESQVLCRQLGFNTTNSPATDRAVLPSNRLSLDFNFGCSGAESELTECSYQFLKDNTSCYPVIVSCTPCAEGDIRLYNGTFPEEGTVENCRGGFWRAVCDINWSYQNSFVVCRELGLPATAAVPLLSLYHPLPLGIYFNCIGNESSLADCPATGTLLCSSENIAGVQCAGEMVAVCSHGDVRLQNRRAEVCVNGIWASICQDDIDFSTIANSICKQVFGVEQSFHVQNCSRDVAVAPVLYDLSCTEQSRFVIHDCTFSISQSTMECNSMVSIECYPQSNCTEGAVRLVDGNSRLDGRFEICVNSYWGVLPGPNAPESYDPLDPSFSVAEFNLASRICRELGLPSELALPVRISGNYPQLLSCGSEHEHCYQPSCNRVNNAFGVICQGNSSNPKQCQHLDIRLVDGSKETEGRLEICAHGYWSNVCIDPIAGNYGMVDYWNDYAAFLVCRKLGFPTEVALHNLRGAPFGSSPMLPVVEVDCGTFYYADPAYGRQDTYAPPENINDCSINNRSSLCSEERTIIGISCGEREYYKVTIEVLPAQASYEIGTEVTLRCVVPPSLLRLPSVRVRWNTIVPDVVPHAFYYDSFENISFVIPAHHPPVANYYCLVLGRPMLLARALTTIKIRAVLKRSISVKHIEAREQGSVHLQIEITNFAALSLLSELTWYHNGSVILPDQDGRITFSNDNKSLTIAGFSPADAGVYKVQFNRISLQPYNRSCNEILIQFLRGYPILAPAVYCVNVNSCPDDVLALQFQRVTIRRQNVVGGESLFAEVTGSGYEEFEQYLNFKWYRNGDFIPRVSEVVINSSITYQETGRYEAALVFDLNRYLYGLGDPYVLYCRGFYTNQLLAPYYTQLPLSWGFIDIRNVELYLDTDVKAAIKNKGATLTCRASIQFLPITMLSLIKNGRIVATSLNEIIQINTKRVTANPFGLYVCQLNASGEIFEEVSFLKEQVNVRLTIETENRQACDFYSIESIEQALFSKISQECRCDFRQGSGGFNYSSINCEESGKMIYRSTIEYSNNEGSETASVIVDRLANQAPFFLIVEGVPVKVVAADCTNCNQCNGPANNIAVTLSGLFIGGFVAGVITAAIIIAMTIIIIRIQHRSRSEAKDSEGKDKDETTDKNTYTSHRVPASTDNEKENIELREQ